MLERARSDLLSQYSCCEAAVMEPRFSMRHPIASQFCIDRHMSLSSNIAETPHAAREYGTQPRGKELRRMWQAASQGRLDEQLVNHGLFDPNLVVDGIPMLVAASESGHAAVVRLLLGHEAADPN